MLQVNNGGKLKPGYALVLPWDTHHVGGVNNVATALYQLLDQSTVYEPTLLISSWRHEERESRVDAQGRRSIWMRIRAPWDGDKVPVIHFLSYALRIVAEMRGALQVARRYSLTVINFHYVTELAFTWAVLRRFRLYRGMLVLSFHGTDLHLLTGRRGLVRVLSAWMLRQADRLIVLSAEMGQRLRDNFDLNPARICIVPNGVDPEVIWNEIRHSPDARTVSNDTASTAAPLIVSLGSFDKVKGHDVLLRAFAKLHQQNREVHLVIAGRSGPELDATSAAVRALNLQDCVRLIADASHAEAMCLLNQARVFVLPSRREGLPLVILEAGVLAKPVVATAVGGVSEIMRDRREGILTPAENADALCDGMLALIADPEFAAAMGKALQARVLESFTAASMLSNYLRAVAQTSA